MNAQRLLKKYRNNGLRQQILGQSAAAPAPTVLTPAKKQLLIQHSNGTTPKEIEFVDGICGSGKTFNAINYAVKAVRAGENICFVQPSKLLIEQTRKNIVNAGFNNPVSIVSDDNDDFGPVQHRVEDYLLKVTPRNNVISIAAPRRRTSPFAKQQYTIGQSNILLISQQAFKGCPNFHGKGNWNLIVDEIPNVIPAHRFNLEKHIDLLKSFAGVIPCEVAGYYQVVVIDRKVLDDTIELENDVYNVFRDFNIDLRNDHVKMYCTCEQWDRIGTTNRQTGEVFKQIEFFGLLQPSIFDGFKSVTIMGAHFQDSLMYQLWRETEFVKSKKIVLKEGKHDLNGRTLTINYLSKRDWSKSIRDRIEEKDISKGIQTLFSGDVIYASNNQKEGEQDIIENILPFATRISNVSHGMNNYSDVNNALVYTAINLTPSHNTFLDCFGLKRDEIKRAIMEETIYQIVNRTSLRNPNSTADVVLCVPDERSAQGIAKSYKGKIIIRQIDTICAELLKEPKELKEVVLSARERTALKEEKIKLLREENQKLMDVISSKMGRNECSRSTIYVVQREHSEMPEILQLLKAKITGSQENRSVSVQKQVRRTIHQSLFSNIYSKQTISLEFTGDDDYIAQLKSCWDESVESKENNSLVSPAKFVHKDGVETERGAENVESADCIWIDQDDGELTPDLMRTIFPNTHFVAMNTYSGGSRNRYMFPTETPMSCQMYEAVWQVLFQKIKKVCPNHGIDQSKRFAFSLFYLPSKARNVLESQFEVFDGKNIVPDEAVKEYTVPVEYKDVSKNENPKSAALANLLNAVSNKPVAIPVVGGKKIQIINEYRSTPAGEGKRNTAFFVMFKKLQKDGLSKEDIEQILIQEAGSDDGRKKQVGQFMKTKKYWS